MTQNISLTNSNTLNRLIQCMIIWSKDLSFPHRGGSRGRVQGVRPPPPLPWDDLRFSNTTGILQEKKMWFIGVEVEQETSALPPKKNPWSASCHTKVYFSLRNFELSQSWKLVTCDTRRAALDCCLIISNKCVQVKNPNWPEANQLAIFKDLNSGLPRTNPANGQGRNWTQGFGIASVWLKPLGYAASLWCF